MWYSVLRFWSCPPHVSFILIYFYIFWLSGTNHVPFFHYGKVMWPLCCPCRFFGRTHMVYPARWYAPLVWLMSAVTWEISCVSIHPAHWYAPLVWLTSAVTWEISCVSGDRRASTPAQLQASLTWRSPLLGNTLRMWVTLGVTWGSSHVMAVRTRVCVSWAFVTRRASLLSNLHVRHAYFRVPASHAQFLRLPAWDAHSGF